MGIYEDMRTRGMGPVRGIVKLNSMYFELMGPSAVFTKGKGYEILGPSDGCGIPINDDKGIRRHINDAYLDFVRG